MKLAAFFSGGKDSCYAIYQAMKLGHTIEALITIIPCSDESHLLHHQNILLTKLQSKSMKIPQIIDYSSSTETTDEVLLLKKLIKNAINDFKIEGIVHGGIMSEFQKLQFEGGEAETFVVNCPFFQKSVKIINSQKIWDGYRGRFEIVDAELENNA